MKILIIKRDKIGDMLLMTPMLEHLRQCRPQAEIHVLANDYNAWVVAGNPHIDHLWVYPRTRHAGRLRPLAAIREWLLTRQLRRMRFDVVIAAGGVVSPRAIKRALRLGGQRTIAYCPPESPDARGLSDPLPLPRTLHEVEANLALLRPLGIEPPATPIWPRFAPPEHFIRAGRTWVEAQGLTQGFVVIGINARREKRKPTMAQIAAWSQAILERWGLPTVLVWQPGAWESKLYPGDDARIADLIAAPPPHIHPFRSEDDVMPVLGMLWHAHLTIVPDGGLAHLASLSPGGVLALFAETDVSPHPDNWRPYAPRGIYLEAKRAVAELSDQQVLDAIAPLIASYQRPGEALN
ncbi:MAG TPA: hypothetical protein PLW86_16980 [Rhodocyclaceae bacterium]|nr:hypothetical protein [Rhodocyclaceae bacterium]